MYIISKYFVHISGLLPKLLLPRMPFLKIESDINALMFFDVNMDASKVTWARATNSEEALEIAANCK